MLGLCVCVCVCVCGGGVQLLEITFCHSCVPCSLWTLWVYNCSHPNGFHGSHKCAAQFIGLYWKKYNFSLNKRVPGD